MSGDEGVRKRNKEEKENDQGSSQDEEGGEDQPPQPVGFWDPKLKHVRHEAMGKWLLTSMLGVRTANN